MKKPQSTETQIIEILKGAESGMAMTDLLRIHRVSYIIVLRTNNK